MPHSPARVLLAGGGYVGLHAARRLEKLLAPGEATISLVSPENFMLYQPLLPEVASGTLEARHIVVPLRKALRRTQLLSGRLVGLDHPRRRARIRPYDGTDYDLDYDHVVIAVGSMTRVLPVPGVAERAVGFQSIAEAIHLRNQVLERIEAAEATTDPQVRRRALTFVFVGGGYTGVEVLAELEDMARDVSRYYPTVRRGDMRWVLVEAMGRILPEVDERLSGYALRILRRRGIAVHLETQLESAEDGRMRLSTGEEFDADTLVWMTGVRPHALVGELGLPTDEQGRLVVDASLRVRGAPDAWAAGDCAAVPDLVGGGVCPPTAQHAERQARQLAENLVGRLRGAPGEPFRHRSVGELVTLGRYKGAADVRGVRGQGLASWLLRRGYYGMTIPTLNRKLRLFAEWGFGLLFRRDVVQLGSVEQPRRAFVEAAGQVAAPEPREEPA